MPGAHARRRHHLSAPAIAFGSTLDGGFALTTQSAGPTSFTGAVGATTPLASLTADGGGAVQLSGPSVDTTGAQSYFGALQLTGSSRLTGSALTLTGPVSGADRPDAAGETRSPAAARYPEPAC
jgi:hypothetical protein